MRASSLVATACVLGVQLAAAGAASAHSGLVSTDPADGASISVSPTAVVLTFDSPVTRSSRVQVTGPTTGTWQVGEAQVSGSTITQPLGPLGPAGEYEIAYRAFSADGHSVSGTSTFVLTAAGPGTSAPVAPERTGGGSGSAPLLAGAGLLLVAGAGAVRVRRRRSAASPQPAVVASSERVPATP